MTDTQFLERMRRLRKLAPLASGSLLLVLASAAIPGAIVEPALVVVFLVALCGIAPAVVYFIAVTIWHWKARYRGDRSDLWGALLLLEVSGWLKLVYLFRHLLPDARGTGRYRRHSIAPPA